jgi:hypothetical protein
MSSAPKRGYPGKPLDKPAGDGMATTTAQQRYPSPGNENRPTVSIMNGFRTQVLSFAAVECIQHQVIACAS